MAAWDDGAGKDAGLGVDLDVEAGVGEGGVGCNSMLVSISILIR